jgi:Flp pilus assembly protein TadB
LTPVGQVYTNLHPCNPITIVHHSDTTTIHDTAIIRTIDTVGNYIHDTVTTTIRNTIHIHDRDTIVDGQQIALLKSQLQERDKQISALNQSVTDNRLQTIQEHSRGNHWQLLFWLLIAALVACVVFYIVKQRL